MTANYKNAPDTTRENRWNYCGKTETVKVCGKCMSIIPGDQCLHCHKPKKGGQQKAASVPSVPSVPAVKIQPSTLKPQEKPMTTKTTTKAVKKAVKKVVKTKANGNGLQKGHEFKHAPKWMEEMATKTGKAGAPAIRKEMLKRKIQKERIDYYLRALGRFGFLTLKQEKAAA